MARDEEPPIELLRRTLIAEWNSWRAETFGAESSSPNLANADLRHLILTNANLRRAFLTDADLTGAEVRRADLAGADLRHADLTGADLRHADLTDANLTGAHLIDADLTDADLTGARLIEADLRHAILTDANLTGAHLIGADLTNANLRHANLRRAHLTDADLRHADLTGARLIAANLTGTRLIDADLRRAQLRHADLTNANLRRALLTDANLHRADVTGADLTDANVTVARLIDANVIGARLSDADRAGQPPPELVVRAGQVSEERGVRIETDDLGGPVDPRVVSDLAVAVSWLVEASSLVGAELIQRLWDERDEGGRVRVRVDVRGSDEPITLSRTHFGSPFYSELSDLTQAVIPWFSGTGGVGYTLKLIGGAKIASTVTWLALPSERRRQAAERAADTEEENLRRDKAARKRAALRVPAVTPEELRTRLSDAGVSGKKLDQAVDNLAPLFRSGFTLTTDVHDVEDSDDDPRTLVS